MQQQNYVFFLKLYCVFFFILKQINVSTKTLHCSITPYKTLNTAGSLKLYGCITVVLQFVLSSFASDKLANEYRYETL